MTVETHVLVLLSRVQSFRTFAWLSITLTLSHSFMLSGNLIGISSVAQFNFYFSRLIHYIISFGYNYLLIPLIISLPIQHSYIFSTKMERQSANCLAKKVKVASCCLVTKSNPTRDNSMDCRPPVSSLRGIPQTNTGVGCHFLLQRIFQTQGVNLSLPAWQVDFFTLESPGKPIS